MSINQKIFFFAVLNFLVTEIIIFYNSFFYFGYALILLFVLLSVYFISPKSNKFKDNYLTYLTPFFYFLGFLFFVIFLSGRLSVHLLAILSSILFFAYLSSIANNENGNPDSNLNSIILILSGFYWFSSLSAARSFLGLSLWVLAIGASFYGIIMVVAVLFSHKQKILSNFVYLILAGIISVELFWVFSFLPYNFINIGFLLLLLIYNYSIFLKKYLNGGLSFKNIKNNLIFILVCLIALLLTAKWT